jgi:hypothetical protein
MSFILLEFNDDKFIDSKEMQQLHKYDISFNLTELNKEKSIDFNEEQL